MRRIYCYSAICIYTICSHLTLSLAIQLLHYRELSQFCVPFLVKKIRFFKHCKTSEYMPSAGISKIISAIWKTVFKTRYAGILRWMYICSSAVRTVLVKFQNDPTTANPYPTVSRFSEILYDLVKFSESRSRWSVKSIVWLIWIAIASCTAPICPNARLAVLRGRMDTRGNSTRNTSDKLSVI